MSWVIWGILLLAQNAAFVANSRARNSDNLWYHAITVWFSNGVFIISQFFTVDKITDVLRSDTVDYARATIVVVFYCVLTAIGGLTTHYLLLKRKL